MSAPTRRLFPTGRGVCDPPASGNQVVLSGEAIPRFRLLLIHKPSEV
jgi:hypothetical protein